MDGWDVAFCIMDAERDDRALTALTLHDEDDVEPPHHEVVEGRFTIINVVGEQESESSS